MRQPCKISLPSTRRKHNEILISNKAKGGSAKNRKTRTPIAYISWQKKEKRASARTCRAAPQERVLSSHRRKYTRIYGPKLLIRPALLWAESTRMCACKCDATAGRWYFGARRGPGDRRPLYIRARARASVCSLNINESLNFFISLMSRRAPSERERERERTRI